MTRHVRFDFYPLRFEFMAREPIFLPAGHAANVLRGALGMLFRGIACPPACDDARVCPRRHTCPYGRIFAPENAGVGPSGLADAPRPFVFRARHLDGRTMAPGQTFHFDLHVFTQDAETLACFVQTFAALAHEGLGPRRGKAELRSVVRLPAGDFPEAALYRYDGGFSAVAPEPVSLSLAPSGPAPDRLRIEFLSPTELKHDHRIATRPEFPILFGRIRDRISTLRRLYGAGALDIDYQGSGLRSADVKVVHCSLRHEQVLRHSSRTGQTHPIGGFLGAVEYQGELSEFLPFLEAARWTGVGRQAVWGKGEIALTVL